uniref:Uncharacterized protein n=1 Tax=Globodera rostochiensis TaxID=31243 RepID=A0A914HDH3_GLORO
MFSTGGVPPSSAPPFGTADWWASVAAILHGNTSTSTAVGSVQNCINNRVMVSHNIIHRLSMHHQQQQHYQFQRQQQSVVHLQQHAQQKQQHQHQQRAGGVGAVVAVAQQHSSSSNIMRNHTITSNSLNIMVGDH